MTILWRSGSRNCDGLRGSMSTSSNCNCVQILRFEPGGVHSRCCIYSLNGYEGRLIEPVTDVPPAGGRGGGGVGGVPPAIAISGVAGVTRPTGTAGTVGVTRPTGTAGTAGVTR